VNALELLIVRALVGEKDRIKMIAEYYINNKSPSEIEREYGISRYAVLSLADRARNGMKILEYTRMLNKVLDYVLSIEPIMVKNGGRWKCRICGAVVGKPHAHIISKHMDVVKHYTSKILNGGRKK